MVAHPAEKQIPRCAGDDKLNLVTGDQEAKGRSDLWVELRVRSLRPRSGLPHDNIATITRANLEIGVSALACADYCGFGAVGERGFDVVTVGAGDYFQLDFFRTSSLAFADIGAVSEALYVHLLNHG